MVDTGSAHSIIHIDTLRNLTNHPLIKYEKNVHRTANNSELRTIGLVKLKIYIRHVPTVVVAEVALDLCTSLVLGNDWIRQNGIDIITTEQIIIKHHGQQVIRIPFATYNEDRYPVCLTNHIEILPEQQMMVPVNIRIQTADTVLFTPSNELLVKKQLLMPHALLKITNGTSWVSILNAGESTQRLNSETILGTVTLPASTSVSLAMIPEQKIHSFAPLDLTCRTCYEQHTSKKELFEHLHEEGHYSKGTQSHTENPVPAVLRHIKELVQHVPNARHRKQVELILIKYGEIFDTSKATTINTTVKHTIEVRNSRPIVQRPYRKTAEQEKAIDEMCAQFHRDNIIRPSQSCWASPVVLQKKKDGTWRFCIDYRKLNEVTEKDNYPLPRTQEIFDTLNGSRFFSKLDFQGGYHQVPIDETDKCKTAFVTRDKFWEYNVMPQGIMNGPPTFQRIVNKLLGRLQWQCALAYIDDIIIFSRSISEHVQHLEQILSLLWRANFRLNPTKCEFVQRQIQFLGHMITEEGISPSPDKVHAIIQIPKPTNIRSATSFVKMAEYYRNHIPNFSTLAQPLFNLTKKDATFTWSFDQQNAFDQIKTALTTKPLLKFPNSELPFIIQVDASNIGIGGVLMQDHGQGEQPVAFMSQKLNNQQQNWSATEKECFAILSSINKWNHYVAGRRFIVRTDHHALCWLNRKHTSNPKLNRWRMALQDYTFQIEHVKGRNNCVPDCLSRYPVDPPHNEDEIEQRSISTQTEFKPSIVGAVTTRRMNQHPSQQIVTSPPTSNPISQPTNEITVFTRDQLKHHQQQDLTLKNIVRNIHRNPFSLEYCLIDGLLHRNVNRFYGAIQVPVVPKSKIHDILLAYHNSSMNGAHFGKDRTYYKIRDRYYWPRMYLDIAQHVQSCTNCSLNKRSRRKPNGHLNAVAPPEGVWENLAMDFVGPITPPSSSGKRYILVITDLFSKFVITRPTTNNSALTAAKVLVEDVMLRYGTPNQILTDNGPHFTAELFNHVTSICGICHIHTTPYNPKANGTCERFNASMCDSLAAVCNQRRTDWDENLSKVVFAYNTSRHATTQITPYELIFGRTCRLPFDLPKPTTTHVAYPQYVAQLQQYLDFAIQMAKSNMVASQLRSKQRYDNHRSNEAHPVGDFVYLKHIGFKQKFQQKYDGPYQVIQRLNDSTYRIQNPSNLPEILNVNVNRLRRCHLPTNSSSQ